MQLSLYKELVLAGEPIIKQSKDRMKSGQLKLVPYQRGLRRRQDLTERTACRKLGRELSASGPIVLKNSSPVTCAPIFGNIDS